MDWNFQWQSKQIFATYFARSGWKVVYISGTGTRPGIFRTLKKAIERYGRPKKGIENPSVEGIQRITPVVLPPSSYLLKKINRNLLIPLIVKNIKKTNLEKPVVITQLPSQTTLDILRSIEYSLLIYHCTDNLEAYPEIVKDISSTEDELIRKSDAIIVTSPFLFNKMKSLHPEVHLIMPGVEYSLFSKADSGPFRKLRKIGYFGGIHKSRIDLPMVFSLARKFPDKEFLFIGPLRVRIKTKPPNVKFLPPVNYLELPEKLKEFDCIIFPYLKNEFTRGIFPIKTFQSLATGKPIISTGVNENLRDFEDVIYLAETEEEFVYYLENLPLLETEEKYRKRKELAKNNSWSKRFYQFLRIIEELMEKK